MNIDERLIEAAITKYTKAIVPVHYAGVACEMDVIMDVAEQYGLFVIEDAAQAMMSTYKGRTLGTIGNIGTYSFHETKNYTSGGEGGLLIINDAHFVKRAEVIREKGTNRSQFIRGQVDKYTWVDLGSSYLPSELQAAYLWGQLEKAEVINQNRLKSWRFYYQAFLPLAEKSLLELPTIPDYCGHNAHMFYIKLANLEQRTALISYLNCVGVNAVFHYVPLHSSPAGQQFGTLLGIDLYTTLESERLVRLPIYYGIKKKELEQVVQCVFNFFSNFE